MKHEPRMERLDPHHASVIMEHVAPATTNPVRVLDTMPLDYNLVPQGTKSRAQRKPSIPQTWSLATPKVAKPKAKFVTKAPAPLSKPVPAYDTTPSILTSPALAAKAKAQAKKEAARLRKLEQRQARQAERQAAQALQEAMQQQFGLQDVAHPPEPTHGKPQHAAKPQHKAAKTAQATTPAVAQETNLSHASVTTSEVTAVPVVAQEAPNAASDVALAPAAQQTTTTSAPSSAAPAATTATEDVLAFVTATATAAATQVAPKSTPVVTSAAQAATKVESAAPVAATTTAVAPETSVVDVATPASAEPAAQAEPTLLAHEIPTQPLHDLEEALMSVARVAIVDPFENQSGTTPDYTEQLAQLADPEIARFVPHSSAPANATPATPADLSELPHTTELNFFDLPSDASIEQLEGLVRIDLSEDEEIEPVASKSKKKKRTREQLEDDSVYNAEIQAHESVDGNLLTQHLEGVENSNFANFLSAEQIDALDSSDESLRFVSGASIPSSNNYSKGIYDDALRRDFTINALYGDVRNGLILDPFNGLEDLYHRRLVMIGNPWQRIILDPLRSIRALRIAGKLGLTITPNLHKAIYDTRNYIRTVSTNRLIDALNKSLTSGNAMYVIRRLFEFDMMEMLYPFFVRILKEELAGEALLIYTRGLRAEFMQRIIYQMHHKHANICKQVPDYQIPELISPTLAMTIAGAMITDLRVANGSAVNPAFLIASVRAVTYLEAYHLLLTQLQSKTPGVSSTYDEYILEKLFTNAQTISNHDKDNAKSILRNFIFIMFNEAEDYNRKKFEDPMFRAGYSLYKVFTKIFELTEVQLQHAQAWEILNQTYYATKSKTRKGRRGKITLTRSDAEDLNPSELFELAAPVLASITHSCQYYRLQKLELQRRVNDLEKLPTIRAYHLRDFEGPDEAL